MKTDDPKFTAFALDELDGPERSEIEALLREDPALNAELTELRRFAANLRRELQIEEGAPLAAEQRAAVLGTEPRIIPLPRPWWRRPWVQSAAAACVIIGVSAVMLSQIETANEMRKLRTEGRGDIAPNQAIAPDPAVATDPAANPVPAAPEDAPHPDAPTLPVANTLAKEPQPVAASAAPLQAILSDSEAAPERKPESEMRDFPLTPFLRTAPATSPAAPTAPTAAAAPAALPTLDTSSTGALLAEVPVQKSADPASQPARMLRQNAPRPDAAKSRVAAMSKAPAKPSAEGVVRARPADFYARSGGVTQLSTVDSLQESETVEEYKLTSRDAIVPDSEGFRYVRPLGRTSSSNTEAYESITDNAFLAVKDHPLSTFSIDVDSASYSNVRRFLNANQRPPKGAVRIEELVNYFRYDYPQPDGPDPFSCALEVATCPWQTEHRLVRIGLKGKEIKRDARPEANLVFLVDVSGSMAPENKLPLVRSSLKLLVDQLNADDSVAIAVYAGASGCVLEPTSDKAKMREALTRLDAGGSTNGAAGIQLAYDLAQRSFKKNGINRVILCTDGDFNVGVTSQSELVSLIQAKAKSGIFLSVMGFGMGNLKDSTLEKLADNGNGNYAYIDTLNEGRRVFVEQMTGTLITIAKDVKVQVEFNPAQVSAYRLIGYENRLLAKEDFNNDAKDAGEIGAGHTVTALYQVVPFGKAVPHESPGVDDLKYQKGTPRAETPVNEPPAIKAPASPELLTVKLRYKQPDADVSKKLEFPVTDNRMTWEQSSRDFRWAASVAGFGLLLRDSPHKGSATWPLVEELALEGKGDDRDGYRAEFVGLIEKAKALGEPSSLVRKRVRVLQSEAEDVSPR